jgi:hypothetical protein
MLLLVPYLRRVPDKWLYGEGMSVGRWLDVLDGRA